MCRAADAAMAMVNRSIELVHETEDASYYLDFVKLHKLLYLAQCSMLEQYGQTMFDEKITLRQCGPYIDGIRFVPRRCGFGRITNLFSDEDFVRPSYWRMKIINQVLEEFGGYSTDDLIQLTKDLCDSLPLEDSSEEQGYPVISPELILTAPAK